MGYRKFRSDHLFTGRQMLGENQVLITDERGKVEEITSIEDAGDGIEYLPGIISPGFVNCHCHLELSHMKGVIPKHTGMTDFLISVVSKRVSDPEAVIDGISVANENMFHSGIVAVGDICNTSFSIGVKEWSGIYYHNFIEVFGFDERLAVQRFDEVKQVFDKYEGLESKRNFRRSIVPHAPYSVSRKLLHLIKAFQANHIVSIHNQESEEENELFLSGSGEMLRLFTTLKTDISGFEYPKSSSLQALYGSFDEQSNLILVHNVHTSAADINGLNESVKKTFWCFCPNANLYITNSLPDIDMFLKNDCTIVIGTDSLASNDQLSVLEELKAIQKHFPHIATETLLTWATFNGAQALKINDRFGSFEKGTSPGVVHIRQTQQGRLTEAAVSLRVI